MTELEKSMMEMLGASIEDFRPNEQTLEERVTSLESELATLKSFVNALGKTELVGDGSAEKPFDLILGLELIPNAYYLYHNVRYVYMGTSTTWDGSELSFDNGWAEF